MSTLYAIIIALILIVVALYTVAEKEGFNTGPSEIDRERIAVKVQGLADMLSPDKRNFRKFNKEISQVDTVVYNDLCKLYDQGRLTAENIRKCFM